MVHEPQIGAVLIFKGSGASATDWAYNMKYSPMEFTSSGAARPIYVSFYLLPIA